MRRLFLVLAALPAIVFAQAQARGDAVTKALDDYIAQHKVVGAAVAIHKTDGTQLEYAAGFQDREGNKRTTQDTLFRLGSISKPVTTIAALQLVDAGKLSLFGNVANYVLEWTNKDANITLRHLLTHTSGVRHYLPTKRDIYYERFTVTKSLDVFKDDPLLFKPGERVSYSTHAFSLVARMVEAASGKTFADYVRDNVAAPSGARTLALEDRSAASDHRSMLYELRGGEAQLETREEDISWKNGGGGMECSAPDLARFGMAAMTGKLLSPQLTDFMFQRQIVGGLDTGRGLGWAIGPHGQPEHGGAQQGCRTYLVLDREFGTVYVVMTNTGGNHPIGQLLTSVVRAWGERSIPPQPAFAKA